MNTFDEMFYEPNQGTEFSPEDLTEIEGINLTTEMQGE